MSLILPELSLHDAVGHLLRFYNANQILDALTDHVLDNDLQGIEPLYSQKVVLSLGFFSEEVAPPRGWFVWAKEYLGDTEVLIPKPWIPPTAHSELHRLLQRACTRYLEEELTV